MSVKKNKSGRRRVARLLIEFGVYKGLPKCIVKGCNKPGQHLGQYRTDGSARYRSECTGHHQLNYNMEGAYRIYKKEYCQNIDGRLGFKCTSTIVHPAQLEVDHINNNHSDNRKSNLDNTLCGCCHPYKTATYGHITSLSYMKKIFAKNRKSLDKSKK